MKARYLIPFLLAAPLMAHATCTGSSPSWTATPDFASVSTCYTNASTGDTITISSGSSNWGSNTLTVSKVVTLQGATTCTGARSTLACVDNTTIQAAGAPSIAINVSGSTRITGITFTGNANSDGHVIVNPAFTGWRIDHNSFKSSVTTDRGVYVHGGYGLIDHIYCRDDDDCVAVDGATPGEVNRGDTSWATSLSRGTANAVYIEDINCDYTAVLDGCYDIYNGARIVFRFNYVKNTTIGGHGLDSGGLGTRSSLSEEVYDNTTDGGSFFTSWNTRGGTTLFFSNTVANYSLFADLRIYRSSGGPWPYGNGNLCDGTNWIDGNTTSAHGYPCRDQPGRGPETGSSTDWPVRTCTSGQQGTCSVPSPAPTYSEALFPDYFWANLFNGSSPTVASNFNVSNSNNDPEPNTVSQFQVVENRDFYNQTGSFTGAVGIGQGIRSSRPANCTAGTAYWSTDQGSWNTSGSGGQGVLDMCTVTGTPGTWVNAYYTPFGYPYPSGATFTWTLTTGANGTVTGTNCASGTYASATTIGACTAVPNTGYSFGSWTGVSGSAAFSGSTNPGPSFSILANSAATANFTVNSYTLTTATAGTGTGTVTTCAGLRVYNTSYNCTVTPAVGSTITSVSGCGGSGTTSYTGLMPASNCTVTATFAATVATPTLSPAPGAYGAAQTVTISDATAGSTIHYTTDGTTPTSGSPTYTVPFSVSTTQTVKAIAVKASYNDSAVVSGLYTINGTLATPTFSPVGTSYGSTQFVTISVPQTLIINQMTETSNATDTAGHSVHRNVYGNCAQSCSGGVPQPPNAGAVSHGTLWCNASQSVTCGTFSLSNITSTLTNSGVSLLENGLGQGGVDSAPTETATYAGVTGTSCGVGATFASNLIGGLTLPGETATSRAVFGLTTASSGFNTSMLAVSKYDTNGDGGNNLERVDCADPNTITVAGQHYEWDSNYNTAGGSYMGFGMDYNFVTSKFRAAFQNAPAWTDMELCPVGGGGCITTYSWPAGDYLFSERHDYWDSGCTFSSATQCAHYGQICLQLWSGGSAVNSLTCYNIQSAATHTAISAIPINKTTWTRPQYGVQHQWDVNGGSATVTANVAFDHLVAYANIVPTICFTNDGSTPTGDGNGNCTHGNVFTGAITVSSSQTLKAIATGPGYTDSNVGTAAYVIGGTASWTQTVVGSGAITGTNSASNNYLLLTTIGPLSATASTGYTFTGWSSVTGNAACSGSTTPCPSFSLATASAATATFTVNSYTLTTATAGSGTGTITGCAGSVNFGATYTCTVTPTGGSTLTSVTGCAGSGTTTYTGTMAAANCTVTATFAAGAPTNQVLLSNVRLSGAGVKIGQ